MRDWNDIDRKATSEGHAIEGGFSMRRNMRQGAPPSRKSIARDYRVREAEEKKVDRLALLNVIGGRPSK